MSTFDPPLRDGEDAAAWAYRTGRIYRDDVPMHRANLAAERRRIKAAGGKRSGLTPYEASMVDIYPALSANPPDVHAWAAGERRMSAARVHAGGPRRELVAWERDADGELIMPNDPDYRPQPGWTAAAAGSYPRTGASDTPLLDDLDRATFGPSREERYREQDLAAEAELREQLEKQRLQAATGLTDAEHRALFGEQ